MTAIAPVTTYSAYSALLGGAATTPPGASSTGTSSPVTAAAATSVTLSDAARAALAQPDFATVIDQARAALDALLVNGAKPADADLSKLDRRQLFAISSNAGGRFTAAEQAAATSEQQRRRDAALAGSLAVARVTDDIEGIYTAALAWLDGASTEEKATPAWTQQRDALLAAQKQLAANPNATPQVDGDIVADYVKRMSAGDDTTTLRDFAAVASDARAALDAQYASARTAGKELVFSSAQKGQMVDFSQFDSRSLAAVALNQDGKFSAEEVLAAKQAMQRRSSSTALAALKASSSDPAAFARNLISAYGSMSPEERQAAGWSDKLYAAAVASYKTAANLADIFGSSATGSTAGASSALSLLDYLDSGSQQPADGSTMSLANILGQ